MRRSAAILAIALTVLVGFAASAGAAAEDYAADPIGLVPFRDSVHELYTLGTDVWEVWICDLPGGSVALEPAAVAATLGPVITPYYTWLSEGRYQPTFRAGGKVASTDSLEDFPFELVWGCESAVRGASTTSPNGVLIVLDGGPGSGYAWPPGPCADGSCPTTFPANNRVVVVEAGAVTPVPPRAQARLATVAHEIGHSLNLAHSYGGLLTFPDGSVNQYDNVVDIMSGLELDGGSPIGTHAYNRYAAGWIDPGEVALYTGGTHTYRLSPVGGGGTEMVAITLAQGYLYSLGLRDPSGWDGALEDFGVDVYLIDSRPGTCGAAIGQACYGVFTRIAPVPPPRTASDTSHVYSAGEPLTLRSWQVSVLVHTGNTYLRITDGLFRGRFVDDDGNPHEGNIEAIAAAGVTAGCDPPANDRYCPAGVVSRAEMAAFLTRALGEPIADRTYQGYFSDVPDGAWYTPAVERLFELGITTGRPDGTYDPSAPVSRAEMAVFLARAFTLPAADPVAGVFGDVPAGEWYAPQAEAIFAAGITTGCSADPLLYCPTEPVPRDQMASFLARGLGVAA